MIPSHFYYVRKSIHPKYTYTQTGDLDTNQLIRQKPYWKQSLSSTRQEHKTLILVDWTAENWSGEKRRDVIDTLFSLISAGFSIYAWQSGQIEELHRDNLIQLLEEQQFLERMVTLAMPKEIESVVIAQLPKGSRN